MAAARPRTPNVDQWADGTYNNQMWSVTVNSNGTYTFVNKCNGLALDMSGGGTPVNGQNISCWRYNGTSAQKMSLPAEPPMIFSATVHCIASFAQLSTLQPSVKALRPPRLLVSMPFHFA